jgi:hypothetical protein
MTCLNGKEWLVSMGGMPIFRIPRVILQLEGLHLQLIMSSMLTTSSSSQLFYHLVSL